MPLSRTNSPRETSLMKSELPLITIGITCFNSEETILRALKSAVSQTYPNFEVIIVDDFSCDNSVDIIQKFISWNKNIRLIAHTKNTGMAGALNTIIANANGELIAWFDDDDISLPNRIEKQYEVISKYRNENEVLVGCWCSTQKKYPNGYMSIRSAIGSRGEIPKGRDILDYHLNMKPVAQRFFGSGTPACSLMTYKEVFRSIGLYDVDLRRTDDSDFAIRLGLAGGHFIGTDEILVEQYWSSGNDKTPKVEYDSQIRLIRKYETEFRSIGHFEFALKWRKIRLLYFSGNFKVMVKLLLECIMSHPILSSARIRNGLKRLLHDMRINR